jgi:uncharacterized protein (TIGR03083 family)
MTTGKPDDELAARFGPMTDTRPEFGRVRAALAAVLADLSPADWQRPTVCAPWLVRDVVAHILGDDLARLSRSRDRYTPHPVDRSSFPASLHRRNQQWVDATGPVSPALLLALLETVTPQVLAYWRGVDLESLGEAVSWASPGPAPVWLDCARDFTEYWTHLHQILEAAGRPALADDQALRGVLDTFMRALPLTLGQHAGHAAGILTVRVPGPAGGAWTCGYDGGQWRWTDQPPAGATTVTLDADVLWRLCTRGVEPAQARRHAEIEGDMRLAEAALQIVSIIR